MTDKEKLKNVIKVNLLQLFADTLVYTREFAKYGGYSGYKEFDVLRIAKQLADSLAEDGVTVQKWGEWIAVGEYEEYDGEVYPIWRCSLCGHEYVGDKMKRCSECDAKMEAST